MHKTGTTALQAALKNYDDGRIRYAQLGPVNHSEVFATLFMRHPATYVLHRLNNRSHREVQHIRQTYDAALTRELETDRDVLMFSGEDISTLWRSPFHQMVERLSPFADKVTVLGYVRDPFTYATSALSQAIRQGLSEFRVPKPEYRRRFEKMIHCLGEACVEFAHYPPQPSLFDDFSVRTGVQIQASPENQFAANSSLSDTAAGILYVWNQKTAHHSLSTERLKRRRRVTDTLTQLFPGRFGLDSDLVGDDDLYEDLRWIEQASGFNLTLPKLDDGIPIIRCEQDLLQAAHSGKKVLADSKYAETNAIKRLYEDLGW